MTTTTAAHLPAPATEHGATRPLLLVAGGALVISGVWAMVEETSGTLTRDAADGVSWKAMALTHLVAFGLLALASGAVLIRGWAGESRFTGPVVAAGLLLAVGAQWYVVFATPLLAEVAPDSVNTDEGWVGGGLAVALLTAALALVCLGIAVLRARVLPRLTGWLLVVAGLGLVVLPGGQLLAGAALLSARPGQQS